MKNAFSEKRRIRCYHFLPRCGNAKKKRTDYEFMTQTPSNFYVYYINRNGRNLYQKIKEKAVHSKRKRSEKILKPFPI